MQLGANVLLVYISARAHGVHQDPQVHFCTAYFQDSWPQPIRVHGVILSQVQGSAFVSVDCYRVALSPFLQPLQDPSFGIKCELSGSALCP